MTQSIEITPTPQDIVSELDLQSGEKYLVQAALFGTTVHFSEGADTPTPGVDYGFALEAGQTWQIEVDSEPIWAWSPGINRIIIGRM